MIITQPKEAIAAFVSLRQGHKPDASWGHFTALGWVRNETLVAGVIYNNADSSNICMHVGAEEGSKWMAKEFLFAAFDYPFNELGMRRITACLRARNVKARKFVENLGFAYEGTFRHYYADDDLRVYGLLKEDCRHLQMRKAA